MPAAIDRMVQQALAQILQPVFEQTFSDGSCGFRPKRSDHQAIKRAKGCCEEGYAFVVDLDLEKRFDTASHGLLVKMAREAVKDEAVISLIKKLLKSGIMADGIASQRARRTAGQSPAARDAARNSLNRRVRNRTHGGVGGRLPN
jgi:retron-type reverse transcriptase